jgi:branched-chain amino acid transport system ATP-binding protein
VLVLEGLVAGYHGLQILHELDLRVDAGEIVALVGANGAGKTTTLRAISGALRSNAGTITFDGKRADGVRTPELVRRGLVQVPEERALFGPLTVEENLRMGAWTQKGNSLSSALSEVFELFPILEERRRQAAETMSGGQQQMLAIGRALMARPKLLMLDEPSMGLAPLVVKDIFEVILRVAREGSTVLLVEQNARAALKIAHRGYVLETGRIVLQGTSEELLANQDMQRAYLGKDVNAEMERRPS